jgi:hypothetical protein
MNNAQGVPLNCGTFVGSGVPVYNFTKPSFGGDSIKLVAQPTTRIVSVASSGTVVQNDRNMVSVSGASIITDYNTTVEQLVPGFYPTSIVSNNSGVILSPNQFGLASGVSAGSATLRATVTTNSEIFSSANIIVSSSAGATSIRFDNYVNNSLAKHINDDIDNRISGLDANSAKPIFTTQNHSTSTYVRNSGCWASGVDLTAISPWNSTNAQYRAGTLISPRHIIFAAHFQINNGASIRFVDNNNNVVTRTMVNKLTHPNYQPYYPDLTVGVLDSDVPASIKFAKILPQNWSTRLPSLSSSYPVPCLALDQEEKALITEWYSNSLNINQVAVMCKPPTKNSRLVFFEDIILFDSGNPLLLIIDNELVIITVWTYGGAGAGTAIYYQKDSINSMMNSLGGGYSLTEVDLSGFNSY